MKTSLETRRKHGREAGTHKENDQRRLFISLLGTVSLSPDLAFPIIWRPFVF